MESKEFIGHGTKHNQYDIIDVVLNMEKAESHIFEYEGKRYLKFSVAARREPSKFGATHTTYVRPRTEEGAVAEPAPEKPAKRRRRSTSKA